LFGYYEPSSIEKVSCLIADMVVELGLEDLLEKYDLFPFEVRVLSKKRTLCEKIMSLVKFSHTDNVYQDLSNKIRHVYDLHMMLKDAEVKSFFKGKDFDKMLVRVGMDDKEKYKKNIEWIDIPPVEAIIFSDVDDCWKKISGSYRTTFKELVYGEMPEESVIVDTLKKIAKRLGDIDWTL